MSKALGADPREVKAKFFAESSEGRHPDITWSKRDGAVGAFQLTSVAQDQLENRPESSELRNKILKRYPNMKWDRTDPIENLIMGIGYMEYVTEKVDESAKGRKISAQNLKDIERLSYWTGIGNRERLIALAEKDNRKFRDNLDSIRKQLKGIPTPKPGSLKQYLLNHDKKQ